MKKGLNYQTVSMRSRNTVETRKSLEKLSQETSPKASKFDVSPKQITLNTDVNSSKQMEPISVGGNATKANNTKQLSKLLKDINLKRNVSNFLSNPSSTIHRDGSEQTKHKKTQS